MNNYKPDRSTQKTWVRNSQSKDKPLSSYHQRLAVIGALLASGFLLVGFYWLDCK